MQTNTYQEIKRQPVTWQKTIETVLDKRAAIDQKFKGMCPEEVIFTGCGTSYYISITAAHHFQEMTGITAKAVPASEIFLTPDAVINKNKKSVLIGSSRSGNTTEVVQALEFVQKHQLADGVAITSNPKSKVADITANTIVLPHVQEKSVVMTSTFTNLLLASQLIAGIVSENDPYIAELKQLPAIGEQVMTRAASSAKATAEDTQYDQFIFLGLGAYLGLASEGMLKMKEMTQLYAEVFNPLEFRHGPISVVTEKTRVLLMSRSPMQGLERDLVTDLRQYGAGVTVIGDQLETFNDCETFDLQSELSDQSRAVLYLPFLQLLAYYRTIHMGLNPDKPRNLDQVVVLKN